MLEDFVRWVRDENESVCDETFEGELIKDGDFSQIEFERVQFVKCRFERADFEHAAFYQCKFVNCDFSNSVFAGSYWKKTQVAGSKGNGGRFGESCFKECGLSESSLCRLFPFFLGKLHD